MGLCGAAALRTQGLAPDLRPLTRLVTKLRGPARTAAAADPGSGAGLAGAGQSGPWASSSAAAPPLRRTVSISRPDANPENASASCRPACEDEPLRQPAGGYEPLRRAFCVRRDRATCRSRYPAKDTSARRLAATNSCRQPDVNVRPTATAATRPRSPRSARPTGLGTRPETAPSRHGHLRIRAATVRQSS